MRNDGAMPAYWISTYREVLDHGKVAAYAKIAGPLLQAAGGKFLARGLAATAYEDGMRTQTVIIEFESVEAAIAAHDSPEYRAALDVLGEGARRDLRIVPGVGCS